jgi:hypothetical protein
VHAVERWYDYALPEVRLRCGLSPNGELDAERKPTTCLWCVVRT